jgi:hypothetical protein
MPVANRLQYYRRIFSAYLGAGRSQLSFWHEQPQANPNARIDRVGEYYMLFAQKADYTGPFDEAGIPLLDYRGTIGRQYNPIAIAQWGLANHNQFCQTSSNERRQKFTLAADWMCANLEQNAHGIWVWQHHFDWEYRDLLKSPWYSGLAQGQGISLLLRAARTLGDSKYSEYARKAFAAFETAVGAGGVTFIDERSDTWFEEYIVNPPTHILNGFIWASWGVYDYYLDVGSASAGRLFEKAVQTLARNLSSYDLGFWSLYEQSGTPLKMLASAFYHRLHVVQLRIMHRLTGSRIFELYAERWEEFERSRLNKIRALCYKSAFKLCYY